MVIDSIFDRWRGTMGPGCAVGASRDGHILVERAYGMANLETGTPNTPSTVFHAASLAKQVTAMAVMLLVRDGKLTLDDDVHRVLAELPDYGHPITVRQLLTHTSGLRDYIELLILQRGRFEEDRITQADFMQMVARQKALNFEPGTDYEYSNTGYALLAVLVQRVSGQSLRDFAAERIFQPLGMSSSRFLDDASALVPGRAQGYASRDGTWHSSMPNYDVYGPTNLLTTLGDLLLWLDNFDHPRVGDSAIIRQMSTRATLANGDSTNYGFGLGLTRWWGPLVVEHEGSDPGFRGYSGHYPEQHLSIVVLCNTRSVNAVGLGHQVAGLYLGERHRPTPPYTVIPQGSVDSVVGAAFTGWYFQPGWVEIMRLSWRDGALYTAPEGGRRLIPVGNNRFQVEGNADVFTFGTGAQAGLVVSSVEPGHHPARFEWEPGADVSPRALAGYVGDYVSVELGATYRVTEADSTLSVTTGSAPSLIFRPAFRDAFTAGQLVLQFIRRGGRVTGFELSHPRARRVWFARR